MLAGEGHFAVRAKAENERDLKEVPENIKADLDIRPVQWIDDVIEIALERRPQPMEDAGGGDTPVPDDKSEDGVGVPAH